ncbi:MAG: 50S ribosomal protein L25 [Candidatus Gracilibacteria bacterium]|jgi:large subunit ribosomal protein L25
MDKVTFPVQTRDTSVKAQTLRKKNLIPAEYYGRGVENMSLQMEYQPFRKLYKKAGSNTVIDLEIEGKGMKNVLIHNVALHPVTGLYTHVEFINVRMDQEVTTTIPVRLEGQAPAVKELAGILIQNLDGIEVTCLPKDLVHEIIVDVSSLVDFNSSITVGDLKIPAGITVLNELEASVAYVTQPQEEEVAATEPVDVSAVEVTTEKKEGEEGAAEEKKEE